MLNTQVKTRHVEVLALLPLLLLGEILLFSRGAQFRGDWFWTIDWSAGSLILTGPIIAAISCWHGYFLLRVMGPAARLAPKPTRIVSAVLLSQASVAIFSQILVLITAAVVTSTANHSLPPAVLFVHVLLQLAWALSYSAIGCLVGLALPYVMTAPSLSIALYLGFLPQAHLLPRSIADFGGSTGSLIGAQPRLSHDAIQTVLVVAVVALTVAAGSLVAQRRRVVVLLLTAVVSAVCLLVSLIVGHATRSERLTYNREDYVCTGVVASVCLPTSGEFLRSKIATALMDLRNTETTWNAASPVSGAFLTQGGELPVDLNPHLRPVVLTDNTLTGSRAEIYRELLPMLVIDGRCFNGAQNEGKNLAYAVPDVGVLTSLIAMHSGVSTHGVWAAGVEQFGRWSAVRQHDWRAAVLDAANNCAIGKFPAPPSG